jgi:hypothetical protein
VYDALLMASPWGRLCHHVASSSLLFAMLAQCLVALFAFRDGDQRAAGRLLPVFFLPAVIALMRKDVAASFSTDVPLTLTLFAAACLVSDHFGGAGSDSGEAAYRVVAITALLAVAVCIKFGTAIFAVSTWLIVIGYHLRSLHTPRWRPVVVSAAIGAAIGLTWMARGIVLSGYPMFPMPIAAAPVEWRAPIEHARAEQAFIVHASRLTAAQLGTIPGIERLAVWFPRWLPRLVKEDPFAVLVPSVIAAVGLMVCIRARAGTLATGDISRQWLLAIPILAGIVAWFSVAPEPRYALYVFWILAALCCAQAERLAAAAGARWVRPTLRAVSLLAAAGAAIVMPMLERPEQTALRAIVAGNLSLTRIGAASAPWTPSLREFVTTSGLVLSVPVNTGGRCGDAPLLCTPNPAPNLRMRDPQDIAQGFVVDGGWQMQIWPYDWLPRFLESWRALQ